MDNYSLLDIFNPPEGYVGQVCVCCALSASQIFIERAIERFTKSNLHNGSINMYLMLDKTGTLLNTNTAKGLVQLQALDKKEIEIQHAKVALMQFGESSGASTLSLTSKTVWRVVVSTGNWTLESASNNVEMVWSVDFSVGDDKDDCRLFADVFAVKNFMDALSRYYVVDKDLWNRARQLFCNIDLVAKKFPEADLKRTRFFSSIGKKPTPLWESIKKRISRGSGKINLIQVGSGFYEQESGCEKPSVLKDIDSFVGELGQKLCKKIVVNPSSAGQIKNWKRTDGWKIYAAEDPYDEYGRTFLHAKYICFADTGKKKYKIYIGSGNLSKMGLKSAFGINPSGGKGKGNIEAGVVVDASENVAKFMLRHGSPIVDGRELDYGSDNERHEQDVILPICPISVFKKNADIIKPVWNKDKCDVSKREKCIVSLPGGDFAIPFLSKKTLKVDDLSQTSLYVKWADYGYWVPVLENTGNLIPEKIKIRNVHSFFEFLDGFPVVSKNDDGEGDDEGDDAKRGRGGISKVHKRKGKSNVMTDVYPLQSSMEFIEKIARKNESISDGTVDDYINLLNRLMIEFPEELRCQWREYGVNFLDVLCKEGFAPKCCDKSKWKTFIKDLSARWNFNSLDSLTSIR